MTARTRAPERHAGAAGPAAGLTPRQQALKRTLDVALAAAGLAATGPLLLGLCALVRLCSPGPALFQQTRTGRHGTPFTIYKLRTMVSSGTPGSTITTARDPRITPLGRFLRHAKLDELPQLWNILRGDMSFVGPRPDVPGYADALQGEDRRLLELRPGLTGPATLCFRDEEKLLAKQPDPAVYNDTVIYPTKTRLNLDYLDRWSLGRDLGFLLVTAVPRSNRWLRLVPEPPDA